LRKSPLSMEVDSAVIVVLSFLKVIVLQSQSEFQRRHWDCIGLRGRSERIKLIAIKVYHRKIACNPSPGQGWLCCVGLDF
jgi:hypothetical protein